MISAPCKIFVRQISPRIFLKMSIFSLRVQNPFFPANANDSESRHEAWVRGQFSLDRGW